VDLNIPCNGGYLYSEQKQRTAAYAFRCLTRYHLDLMGLMPDRCHFRLRIDLAERKKNPIADGFFKVAAAEDRVRNAISRFRTRMSHGAHEICI